MPGTPAWRITPRGRRSLGEMANTLYTPGGTPLALLIGAGVDQAISGRPGWTRLLTQLGEELSMDDGRDVALAEIGAQWPMETAEALRLSLGPQDFGEQLQRALPPVSAGATSSAPVAVSIAGLVEKGVQVIVTLNYTEDLSDALRRLLPKIRIRVVDSTELTAWPLGRLFQPLRGEVHIVKIHGSLPEVRGSHMPSVLLDRSSYDSALMPDSQYLGILARLFEDFSVLSLGVSWTDVPLRDAAARVRRRLPVARPMHYVARPHSADGAADWWEERALTSAYGLRPLYYADHSEVGELAAGIADLVSAPPHPDHNSLVEMAAWLDRFGDYESHQQSRWFAEHWRKVSESIREVCSAGGITAETWMACIQIERHLRHFIWFWLDPSERKDYRRMLWLSVAGAWDILSPAEQDSLWQDEAISEVLDWGRYSVVDALQNRALIDFAIGVYEVMGGDTSLGPQVSQWKERLESARRHNRRSVTGRRLALASRVWSSPPSTELIRAAQDACWEGIEAKVALDIVQIELGRRYQASSLQSPRDLPAGQRHNLFVQIDHARSLGRVAGCSRREAGAIVLASFLAPADQAEGDLIAAYRRLGDLGGGHYEPTAAWSLIIGLIALFADQAGPMTMDDDLIDPLCAWLRDKCGYIPIDDDLLKVVRGNYANHWNGFHRRASNLAPKVASRLLSP